MELIDLSLPLRNEIPVYPGDQPTSISIMDEFKGTGWTVSRISTSLHAGTHVESSLHAIPGGKTLAEYPLDKFYGTAQVISREDIGKVEIDCDVLLIATGCDKLWPSGDYPTKGLNLSEEEVLWIAKHDLKAVGNDTVSIGNVRVHAILFERDFLILESLCNLERLRGLRPRLYFFPLNLTAESSPVRVVAQP